MNMPLLYYSTLQAVLGGSAKDVASSNTGGGKEASSGSPGGGIELVCIP